MVSFINIYGKIQSRYNPNRIKVSLWISTRSDNKENIFASETGCQDNLKIGLIRQQAFPAY